MKNLKSASAALLVFGLAASGLAHAAQQRDAAAPPTVPAAYTVVAGVGTDDFAENIYVPGHLRVYAGDTVSWHNGGKIEPHDIVFGSWAAVSELAAHMETVIPQRSGPPVVAFNPQFAFPSAASHYDGSGLANSGILNAIGAGPQRTWSLTFTKPGTYRYWCLFHFVPGSPDKTMGGVVEVLPRPAPAKVYQVQSGYDDGTARDTATSFFPERLTIHVGNTVVWTPGFHNVAFGPDAYLAQLRATFVVPQPQKQGPPLLTLNPKVIFPYGGPTYDGTGVANSGLLISPKPHTFSLTFTKAGVYHYQCSIHTGMDGTITVLP